MEFTYHGIVRAGFGFYNPNHAATTIVMLLPFLWWGRNAVKHLALKILFLIIEFILTYGLILTFSRTGIIAYVCAAAVWWIVSRSQESNNKRELILRWLKRCSIILFMVLAAWHTGAFERFTDTGAKSVVSTTSRFDVWEYGLQLFNNNPHGVGADNSGKIVTLFYNERPRAGFRTLLNSFLTILVEHGVIAGSLMTLLIGFSVLCLLITNRQTKDKNPKVCSSRVMLLAIITGALVCGSAATPFDFNVVFPDEPIYGELNDKLQTALLVFFGLVLFSSIIIGIRSSIVRNHKFPVKLFAASLVMTTIILTGLYCAGTYLDRSSDFSVTVYKEADGSRWVRKIDKDKTADSPATLLFPCATSNLDEIKSFAENVLKLTDYAFPLNNLSSASEIISKNTNNQIVLCSDNASFASYADKVILYKPTVIPNEQALSKVRHVYLYKWDEKGDNYLWESAEHPFSIQLVDF